MGLSFHETMRGDALSFTVKAEASHLADFARSGEARLVGVLDLGGREIPVHGHVVVRPFGERRIHYALRGEGVRFTGEKRISALRPVHSFTFLPGQLWEGEARREVALRFDLRELLPFVASWSLSSSFGRAGRAALGPAELARLDAFAEAMIEPGLRVPAWDHRSRARLGPVLADFEPALVQGLGLLLRGLDLAAPLGGFRRAPLERRRRVVRALAEHQATRAAFAALSAPVKAAHFGRPDYLEAIGLPHPPPPAAEPPTREDAQILEPEGLEPETELECDVVVVGTGAGGAVMAAKLAEAGLAVAIVEEGRKIPRQAMAGDPLERVRRMWRDGGATWTLGRSPILVPRGRMVGGTTAINSGTCLRAPDAVLESWRQELGFPSDFAPQAMARRYAEVEAELGVSPADPKYLGPVATVVAEGARAMGLRSFPLPRNAPDCDGQGTCILGCPTDAKRATHVSWVPRALRAGATMFSGMRMTALLRSGRRAVGIEARGVDRFGSARRLVLRARAVVLAAGSIEGARLLMECGVRLPWLGRNLSVHPALGMSVLLPGVAPSFRAIPQGYGVDIGDDAVAMEGFWLPPPLQAPGVPLVGAALTRWMDAQDRVAQFGLMVRDGGDGRVLAGPDGRAIVRYDLSPRSLGRLRKGAAILAELLLRGGGSCVLAAMGPVTEVADLPSARRIATTEFAPEDVHLLGAHPLGTMRLGASPEAGVIDFEHRLFGTDNVYVVDGGAVPTSLGVNPQMTIMALALRAAEALRLSLGA